VIINLGQLAGKDIISDHLQGCELSRSVHNNLTAILASLLTGLISLPIDNIKVKLQKQDKLSMDYKGIADCLVKSVRREGMLRLWVGFPIYLVRGTPHSFILIRMQQFLSQLWKKEEL
jgi:solute carrier family 25 (mitochondrial oxoglutarate transporter), member 11